MKNSIQSHLPLIAAFHLFKCVQIWRSCGGELFSELQKQAQKFMDEIADLCEKRYEEICADSRGKDLMALNALHHTEQDCSQQSSLDDQNSTRYRDRDMAATITPFPSLEFPTRQDHEQVLPSSLWDMLPRMTGLLKSYWSHWAIKFEKSWAHTSNACNLVMFHICM